MDDNKAMNLQATNTQGEPRKTPSKSARVAFGPDLETYILPRDESPAPSIGLHHRSFTTVEQKQSAPARPTSSSAGDGAVISKTTSRLPLDFMSDTERPKPTLKRAKSDSGQRLVTARVTGGGGGDDDEEDFAMRHGWQEEYTSSEYLKILHSVSTGGMLCYHPTCYDLGSDYPRISICTSRRSVTRRMASHEIQLEAGQARTGA